MRVGIIQSSYIPWRGYFDFIRSVDLFILLDDVAFGSKGSWRHRNQLKFGAQLRWLTVPVRSARDLPIDRVPIDSSDTTWADKHRQLVGESLEMAPYFADALTIWEKAFQDEMQKISALNTRFIHLICDYLGIKTRIVHAREYDVVGSKTDRLINLLIKVGATTYLSGPTAAVYLDEDRFRQKQITLEYKNYDYMPYPQVSGEFNGNVSVLDLIANTGSEAKSFLQSRAPDRVAIS